MSEVKTRWSEGGCVIEVCDPSPSEDGIVYSRLRLEERSSNLAKVWELRWDYADALSLSRKIVYGERSEWGGEVTVVTTLPESPWMYRYEELVAKIERLGVKETLLAILDYFLRLVEEVVVTHERGESSR